MENDLEERKRRGRGKGETAILAAFWKTFRRRNMNWEGKGGWVERRG